MICFLGEYIALANTILIVVGIIVIIIGIAAFLNPNFSRLINAPGSPRLKASIAMIVGVIILLIGLIIQLTG
jgi:hypothetical protein